jgi:hypothetical protein
MTTELWNTLDVDPPVKEEPEKKEIVPYIPEPKSENNQDDDFELSRKTIKNMIEKGNDALEDLINFASQDQSPRGYEVVSTLIKTISDAAKDLQSLHATKHKITLGNTKGGNINKNQEGPASITVERAVFCGTSSDLLAQIREAKKNAQNDE